MCSIMCYVGTLTEKESEAFLPKFTEGFEKTKSRGPDMSEVLQFGSGVCAFHRLAIMDLDETGMQPFCLDGSYSICNGELYGFRKMKRDLEAKGYAFTSDSDCEIVLPLYREYGTKMFALLDAEFLYRCARPHWDPSSLLRVYRRWCDLLCQRAEKHPEADEEGHAVSPGTLL